MVPINPGIIAITLAAEADRQRRNAAIERDRVHVGRETCLRKASSVLQPIMAERERRITQLVEQAKAKRIARNRWLPRWFQFSLDNGAILEALAQDVYSIYKADTAIAGPCKRLLDICEASTAPTVSVTRRDWNVLQCFLATGSIAPHLLRQ
jgi:hypothetical protein